MLTGTFLIGAPSQTQVGAVSAKLVNPLGFLARERRLFEAIQLQFPLQGRGPRVEFGRRQLELPLLTE